MQTNRKKFLSCLFLLKIITFFFHAPHATYEKIPAEGIAKTDGFIVAAGSSKPESFNVLVDGVLHGFVVNRDYETEPIPVTVPIKKGSTYKIYESVWYKYFIPLNKS